MEETHPVLAAVAFLATLIFGAPNYQESAMSGVPPVTVGNPTLISISPKPPVAGQSAEICYAFQSGQTAVSLRLTWFDEDGVGSTVDLLVTSEGPCTTAQVPADADSYTVEDLSGKSSDISGFVN